MSPDEPQVPPVGEEIHVPASSIQPLLLAIGLTFTLIGLTLTWILTALGAVLSIWVIVRWIGDTRRDIAELPAGHE